MVDFRWLGPCALLALTGCLSGSVFGPPNQVRPGLGSDLRLFFDDACLPPPVEFEDQSDTNESLLGGALSSTPVGAGAALGAQVASGIGEVLFRSIGRAIEESASPDIATATDVATGLFYEEGWLDESLQTRQLSRQVSCLHIVRNGFRGGGLGRVDETRRTIFETLGLTSRPSFYAYTEFEPAPDGSPYFRANLIDLVVDRFEQPGAEGGTRDVIIFLEFGAPASARTYAINADGAVEARSGGPFAAGAIQLSNVRKGFFADEDDLVGKGTAWLTMPPGEDITTQFPFNLYVDVVEVKQGNPVLADIGRSLQSGPVVVAAGEALGSALDNNPRRAELAEARFERRRRERRLKRTLEDELFAYKELLADEFASPADIRRQRRLVEDAIDDMQARREVEGGWESEWPSSLINEALDSLG